jgi:hypothetical protein
MFAAFQTKSADAPQSSKRICRLLKCGEGTLKVQAAVTPGFDE